MFGIGPVPAVQELLRRTCLRITDIDLVELNEAFASLALAVMDDLELDPERTNGNGGAIALSHPVGATGLVLWPPRPVRSGSASPITPTVGLGFAVG